MLIESTRGRPLHRCTAQYGFSPQSEPPLASFQILARVTRVAASPEGGATGTRTDRTHGPRIGTKHRTLLIGIYVRHCHLTCQRVIFKSHSLRGPWVVSIEHNGSPCRSGQIEVCPESHERLAARVGARGIKRYSQGECLIPFLGCPRNRIGGERYSSSLTVYPTRQASRRPNPCVVGVRPYLGVKFRSTHGKAVGPLRCRACLARCPACRTCNRAGPGAQLQVAA
jgi:hypothetical protein